MFSHFVAVQYCFTYLIDQIPVGLLLYSHVPTAILALLFGTYVAAKTHNLSGAMLFLICTCFALWCILDLTSWFAFLGSPILMLTWSIEDLVALMMFFCSYIFLYSFVTGTDIPRWQQVAGLALIMPTAVWTMLGMNLTLYDANACVAIENDMITQYPYVVEAIFIIASLIFTVRQYLRPPERMAPRAIALAGSGVVLFLAFFFSSTLLVNILAPSDSSSYVYNYEIYGLFGMPLFIAYFGYLIVRYKAFDLRIFGAQALVLSLAAIVLSEFAFVTTTTNRILVSVTLVLIAIVGRMLTRSVKEEIGQRKEIQRLSDEKSEFMTFASHEIRNPITAIRGYASLIYDGTTGETNADTRLAAQKILVRGDDVLSLIAEFLSKSKVELGKTTYTITTFDSTATILALAEDFRPHAIAQGLTLEVRNDSPHQILITADETKLREVVGNLIDNAIKYTKEGGVKVSVERHAASARIMVSDTGPGIAPDVLPKLFHKFSRADAQKANLLGTGVGLYLGKTFIEGMGGHIWAESDGPGKGSRFIIEFPLTSR